jgi:hypothetical protein
VIEGERDVLGEGRCLTAAETAWLMAIPTAVVAALAILLLGPPLGRALLTGHYARFFQHFAAEQRPEPIEQGRFLIALSVPLLLAALTVIGVRPRPRRASRTTDVLVVTTQAIAVAFVALCLLQQETELLGTLYPPSELYPLLEGTPRLRHWFTSTTLIVAGVGTLALVVALRDGRMRTALTRLTREKGLYAYVAGALAIAAVAVWLLHAFYTEGTLGTAFPEVIYHVNFTLDETFAVLDGRAPLVNYAAQYGSLWPYAFAGGMSLFGKSLGVWVAMALAATGFGMVAIYGVLRRAARSAIGGLLLFLPVLATSFFILNGTLQDRYTYANYFGTFPLRYAGPSILAWLVARRLDRNGSRRNWPLFLAAGLVVLNNVDVGVPAFGATLAALLWSGGRSTRTRRTPSALEALAGLAGAFALVCAVTLTRAHALPDLGLLLRFSRLFAVSGFGMYRMPTIGLHLAIYVTFVAALGVATVRAVRAEPDRLLTGMLAWSGVFGLGAGAYFAGRSTPENLGAIFFPWAFALALLLVPALRALGTTSWRRPPLAEIACAFAFLVMTCSLAQTPTPWEQLDRLRHAGVPVLADPVTQRFVAQHTRRGEPVAILLLLGHRIAARLGVSNVSPYSNSLAMPTAEQLSETIAALSRAGGSKLFIGPSETTPDIQRALTEAGFTLIARSSNGSTALWLGRGSG